MDTAAAASIVVTATVAAAAYAIEVEVGFRLARLPGRCHWLSRPPPSHVPRSDRVPRRI